MFAAIAQRYDLNNRLHSFGRDQMWRRRAVAMANVGPDDHVLDVACGTGDLTEAFARARPAAVTGLDFTAEMLAIAREKASRHARKAGVPKPEYVEGDAMALPFGDASFDIVSIAFGIRNVAEPECALGEFRRVLRPGGRLIVLEFSTPQNRVLRALNGFYTCRLMPITATLLAGKGGRSGAYRYLPASVTTFQDSAELVGSIARAGFKDVSVHPMTFGVCAIYRARL